jgi:23S rRNA (guanosine2251-2'-O)-methyltransferase
MSQSNYIVGFHAVNACIARDPNRIELLVVDSQRHDLRMTQLLALAEKNGIELRGSNRQDLDKLSDNGHHQGVLAYIKKLSTHDSLEEYLEPITQPFLLILDGVQDPHNLGACLRTANAAGVHAVIAPKDRAVGLTSVVEKVASGALSFTPFFQVTNLARTLEFLKARGVWLYGTSDQAQTNYTDIEYSGSVGIVMGSEGKGMRRLTEEHCDYLIQIPMHGTVSSLNVSVATGICLFEVVRQNIFRNQS